MGKETIDRTNRACEMCLFILQCMRDVHECESVFPFWSAGSKTKEGVVSSVNTGKKSCMFEPLLTETSEGRMQRFIV